MHRPLALPALLVVAAVIAGACGAAAPAIADPAEILAKSVTALQDAKSVHLEATVEGTIKLDLTGTGSGGDIALTGTKLVADVDIKGGNLKANLAVPALLGMTADVVVVGTDTYLRSSFGGDKYAKSSTTDLGVPVDPGNPGASIAALKDWLAKPGVDPKKLADTACGSKQCYQVEIDLTAEELKALMPNASGAPGDGGIVLTILVERDSLKLAGATIKVTSSEVGDLTLKLVMSNWDAALTITAPPAAEIQ